MPSSNKIAIKVVVNGTETLVQANLNEPLHVVAQHALNQTHNGGRPLSEWELKDASGHVLDLSQKVSGFQFAENTILYLQPTVGVNGLRSEARRTESIFYV